MVARKATTRGLFAIALLGLAAAACPGAESGGSGGRAAADTAALETGVPAADSVAAARGSAVGDSGSERGAGHALPATGDTGVEARARGIVSVVGAEPRVTVMLTTDSGQLLLEGPLSGELATLHGAQVSVAGTRQPPTGIAGGGVRFAVSRYVIDSIAGARPVVGVLTVSNGEVRVGTTRLSATPKELLALGGAKVWVAGTREPNGALRVSSYGVLRPVERRP